MQGYALLDDARRATTIDGRVEVLASSGEWTNAAEPLHRLWESYTPVHQTLLREALPAEDRALDDVELARREGTSRLGAGLGPSFGVTWADLTGEQVALIPAAHGGTSLEQWTRGFGGRAFDSTETFYGALLERVRRAQRRREVRLRGLLWYQGESDATSTRATDYGERFDAWIDGLRHDIAAPELPAYVVQLGRFAGVSDIGELNESSWDAIRESQRTLPRRVPFTGVVSAIDLGLTDAIHIDAPGLVRLGRRLARVAHAASSGPDVESVGIVGTAANGNVLLRVRCSGVNGGWMPDQRMPGFRLYDSDDFPIRDLAVIESSPDPIDPTSIIVVTSAFATAELAGLRLGYGLGFDPVCLAVDGNDLPLPAFAPQPIGD